jgi:multiple sugar transport system permease protein
VYTAFFNQSTPYGTDASLMYAIYIFNQAFMFFKMGYASALAWVLFLIIGVITIIQILASRRFVYYEGAKR